jgi:hypothetical protein
VKNSPPLSADLSSQRRPHSGLVGAWVDFWFSPIAPIGLHWLRLFGGLLFCFWLLPFAGHQTELFSLAGWRDTQAVVEMAQMRGGPSVSTGWSLLFLFGGDATLVNLLWWGALLVFVLFALGMATRITSILTWLCVISFVANPSTFYDADYLLIILAFYLMIGYVLLGQWSGDTTPMNRLVCNRGTFLTPWKWDCPADTSYAANLAIRLLQIHFAIIFMTAGLAKLQFDHWWHGVALWFPLHDPFTMTAERLRSLAQGRDVVLFFLSLAEYLMLAWLIAFPFFAWRRRWRWLVVGGGAVAWLGCVFVFGDPLFGPVYLLGTLSFLSPEEWQNLTDRVQALMGRWFGGAHVQPAKKTGLPEKSAR